MAGLAAMLGQQVGQANLKKQQYSDSLQAAKDAQDRAERDTENAQRHSEFEESRGQNASQFDRTLAHTTARDATADSQWGQEFGLKSDLQPLQKQALQAGIDSTKAGTKQTEAQTSLLSLQAQFMPTIMQLQVQAAKIANTNNVGRTVAEEEANQRNMAALQHQYQLDTIRASAAAQAKLSTNPTQFYGDVSQLSVAANTAIEKLQTAVVPGAGRNTKVPLLDATDRQVLGDTVNKIRGSQDPMGTFNQLIALTSKIPVHSDAELGAVTDQAQRQKMLNENSVHKVMANATTALGIVAWQAKIQQMAGMSPNGPGLNGVVQQPALPVKPKPQPVIPQQAPQPAAPIPGQVPYATHLQRGY